MSLPRVTVIIVTAMGELTGDLYKDLSAPLSGSVLEAIYSVQQQDYPKSLTDLCIVRNVGGQDIRELQVFAVKESSTPWVAFLREDEIWESDFLSTQMEEVLSGHAAGRLDRATNFSLVHRDVFLGALG